MASKNQKKTTGKKTAPQKKKQSQNWIVYVAVFAVLAVLILVLYARGFSGTTTTAKPHKGGNSQGITLDESLTYFADINIKGYGTVTVELDQTAAPITVANFVELAQSGFYDGLTFHRIMNGYMMQGGDPEGTGFGGAEKTIVGEFKANGYDNPLSHTRGAISMARSQAYNSASSQFFIVQRNFKSWDGQYAVFGYVTEGMDIVDKICINAEPTDGNGSIPASKQPVMTSVKIRTEPAA